MKPDDTEWLSVPPGNAPPRFGFLGDKWGWQANEHWQRLIHGTNRAVAVKGHGMEFDSLDFLTNCSRPLLQATNPAGDRLWVFNPRENPLDKLLQTPGAKQVAASDIHWREGNPAEIRVEEQIPVGLSNQTVSVGWSLRLWMNPAQSDSVRLTFFTTLSEFERARMRWMSNTLTEVHVRTNTHFGARVTVPTNGTVFLLSGRTNAEGKYFGALLSPSLP